MKTESGRLSLQEQGFKNRELQRQISSAASEYGHNPYDPSSVNNTWWNIWNLIGQKTGIKYDVPKCDRTAEELKKLHDKKRFVLLLPDHIYTPEGLVELGKILPESMQGWFVTPQGARIIYHPPKGGCIDTEADDATPYAESNRYNLTREIMNDNRKGQRLPTYLMASFFRISLTGNPLDEKSISLLTGSLATSEKHVLNAAVNAAGKLMIGWMDPICQGLGRSEGFGS